MDRVNLIVLGAAITAIVAAAGFVVTGLQAQEAIPPASEEKLSRIVDQCSLLKSRLLNVEKTEVAARINRGRAYDQELIPYVSAFNSRVAANKVDAPELIGIAAELQNAVGPTGFASLYSDYADELDRAISSDCENNPSETYTAIEGAKIARQIVAEQVTKIDGLIAKYISELEAAEARFAPVINRPDQEETGNE